jgi:hypothetical protein
MRKARLLLGVSLVVVTAGLTSNTALATQRYAAQTGSGTACTLPSPCDGRYAMTGGAPNPVANGDEVILLPGTYDFGTSSEVTVTTSIDVHGQAGSPVPVLNGGAMTGLLRLSNDTATLHDVDLEYGGSPSSGAYGALMVSGGTAYRVIAHTLSTGALACTLSGNVTAPDALIRDSLCFGEGNNGVGVGLVCGCSSFNASLRNVDAVGTQYGLDFESSLLNQTFTVDAKNVIAEGGTTDAWATATNPGGGNTNDHAFVNLDHSAYDSYASAQGGTGNTASVTPVGTGTNIAASPAQMFLCAPGCGSAANFHQLASSPTINAGATDSLTGTTDLDGHARPQGAAMDIGAYEATPTPTSGGGGPKTPPFGSKKKCKKKKHRAAVAKKCKKRKK